MTRSGLVHPDFLYNDPMRYLVLSTLLVLTVLSPGAVAAAGSSVAPGSGSYMAQAEGLTLDQAVARAEKKYGARAVRAEEKTDGDRRVYRIRLLSDDGRVFDVTVDASTGKED